MYVSVIVRKLIRWVILVIFRCTLVDDCCMGKRGCQHIVQCSLGQIVCLESWLSFIWGGFAVLVLHSNVDVSLSSGASFLFVEDKTRRYQAAEYMSGGKHSGVCSFRWLRVIILCCCWWSAAGHGFLWSHCFVHWQMKLKRLVLMVQWHVYLNLFLCLTELWPPPITL